MCGFQGFTKPEFAKLECEFDKLVGKQTPSKDSLNKFNGLKDVILLDTGSSIEATFMNPDFVQDIRPAKKILKMATNAGTKKITMEGDVPGFGEVCYDPSQMANIIGFRHLAMKHDVTYDKTKDCFDVVMKRKKKNRIIRFVGTDDYLYVYKPDTNFKKTSC